MNLLGIKNGIESVNDAAFAKLASVAGLPISEVSAGDKKDANDYLPLRARIPEGTPMLEPEYFDEACIGYEFRRDGGIRLSYAGELCMTVLRRNSATELSMDEAAAVLGNMTSGLNAENAPAFIWGLDA